MINAEVEERRERPDGFALGRDVAQEARRESSENVHGQRPPFAQQQRRKREENSARGADKAPADNAQQDRSFEGDVRCLEVAHRVANQHTQRDGRPQDENDLQLLAEGALFAKEQDAEAPRADQHAADRRGHTEADQDSNENETRVHGKQGPGVRG